MNMRCATRALSLREELTALIEGRLCTASAKDELVKLATRLIVEEALEGQATRPGLSEWISHGPAEDGRGADGICGAADCRAVWEDYQAFAQRDLSEYEIRYLFVDGIVERLRPGAKREPVLAAWGYDQGRRVLLHMMTGAPRQMAKR